MSNGEMCRNMSGMPYSFVAAKRHQNIGTLSIYWSALSSLEENSN